jgi:uncharacterized glyoxalase superfamily protein PhnB
MSDPVTDPMDALRTPIVPIDPDPAFAARLRQRLQDALLERSGGAMTDTRDYATDLATEALPWPPTLTPYIAVSDGRAAIEWYVTVFGAERRGDPYVMADGSIGHAELGLGDAVLMLAEGSSEVPVAPPTGGPHSHTLHLAVDDVDATVRRAAAQGAEIEREPVDEPYGRVGVLVDPFGHRWLVNQLPARATRARHGDVNYITMAVPDDERAKAFYGAVLGWEFEPGRVPRGWGAVGVQPMFGLWGGQDDREIQLCYRVADVAAAAERVRTAGGVASAVERRPYGLMSECVDDQGAHFQLWQPAD